MDHMGTVNACLSKYDSSALQMMSRSCAFASIDQARLPICLLGQQRGRDRSAENCRGEPTLLDVYISDPSDSIVPHAKKLGLIANPRAIPQAIHLPWGMGEEEERERRNINHSH